MIKNIGVSNGTPTGVNGEPLIPLGDGRFKDNLGNIYDGGGNILESVARGNRILNQPNIETVDGFGVQNTDNSIVVPPKTIEGVKLPTGDTDFVKGTNLASSIADNAGAIGVGLNTAGAAVGDSDLGDALKGAGTGFSTGAAIGSVIPGVGTAIGGGIGAVAGGITGVIKGNKAEEAERKRVAEVRQRQIGLMNTQATNRGVAMAGQLNDFKGNKNTGFFRDGGSLDTESHYTIKLLDQGQGEEISDGLFLASGDTHEQGGIGVSLNGDNVADVEIENDEVIDTNKERVFSDTIKPDSDILDKIKSDLGISTKGTYSDVIKKIGKTKAKLESKGDSEIERTTKEEMLDRVNVIEDALFEDQQLQNGDNSTDQFRRGGRMMKKRSLRKGGNLSTYGKTPTGRNGLDFNPELTTNALSAVNLFANNRAISGLETDVNPNLIAAQRFNFRDTTSARERKNAEATREVLNTIDTSSVQSQAAAKGNLLAKRLRADNDVNISELQREDSAKQRFRSEESRRLAINSGTINRTLDQNLARRNRVRSLRQSARNQFIGDFQANRQTSVLNQLEQDKALLTFLQQGDTGVNNRLVNRPEFRGLRDRLGLNRVGN